MFRTIWILRKMNKAVEIPFKVNTYDIDIAGHLNNIVYVRWLEDLRIKCFSNICDLQKLLADNFYLVVASCEMKYKKQIKLFEKPVGRMTLQSYARGIFIFTSEIAVGNCISFNATQKCVLVNLKTNKMFTGNMDSITAKFSIK